MTQPVFAGMHSLRNGYRALVIGASGALGQAFVQALKTDNISCLTTEASALDARRLVSAVKAGEGWGEPGPRLRAPRAMAKARQLTLSVKKERSRSLMRITPRGGRTWPVVAETELLTSPVSAVIRV